jgi:hypothetical protein
MLILEPWRLILGSWELTLEPLKLTLHSWRLMWKPFFSSLKNEASPGVREAQSGVARTCPGAIEAHLGGGRLTFEHFWLTMK